MMCSFRLAKKLGYPNYFTNSEENHDGAKLYMGFGAKPTEKIPNEFGTEDYIFNFDVTNIDTIEDFINYVK